MKASKTGNREYRIRFNAHCGMSYNIEPQLDSIGDARAVVAMQLREYRKANYGISVLKRGVSWELSEPDAAFMIPDDAGFMTIQSRIVR